MEKRLLLLFLALPSCEGLAESKIEFYDSSHFCPPRDFVANPIVRCDQNPLLANAADSCLASFAAYINQNKRSLQVAMLGNLREREKAKLGQEQLGNLGTSGVDYRRAKEILAHLVKVGNQTKEEVSGYRGYLKLAFHWPRGTPFPDIEDPKWEAYFNSDECYGTSNIRIRETQSRLAEMLSDLERSQAKSGDLRDGTFAIAERIGAAFGSATSMPKRNALAADSGKFPQSRSDVTGILEDKEKQKTIATGIKVPHLPGLAAASRPSEISRPAAGNKIEGENGLLENSPAFAGKWGLYLADEEKEKAKAAGSKRRGASAEEKSLGALVWNEANSQGRPTSSFVDEGSGAVQGPGNSDPQRQLASPMDSLVEIASAEQSLFQLVSQRYRHTELFRHSATP